MAKTRWTIVLAVLLGVAATARAEDREAARKAYQLATQHYDLGEYQQALDAFKEAYRNDEDPAFLFNIGQCHRQLGDIQQAVRDYKIYLLKVPNAPNADEVRGLIANLERTISAEQASKASPPEGTAPPGGAQPTASPPPAAPAAALSSTPASRAPAKPPLYRRWWLWTAVGAVVVAAVGIGVGVGVAESGSTPTAQTALGTVSF